MCGWGNLSIAYTPSSYALSIFFGIVSFLAFIGAIIGYVLSKLVRGKYMAIGSAVYWTISLINLYFTTFYIHDYIARTVNAIIFFSMFLVPFLNIAYIVGKYGLKAIKVFIIMFLSTLITLLVGFTILYSLVVAVFSVSVYELYELAKRRYGETRQMLVVISLVAGIGLGSALGYAIALPRVSKLQSDLSKLIPVTYYTVDERFNITDLRVGVKSYPGYATGYIRGNITNIGDELIDTVYVYIILRNPDGTSDFDPEMYDELENLSPGETVEFEVLHFGFYKEQPFEVLLIY